MWKKGSLLFILLAVGAGTYYFYQNNQVKPDSNQDAYVKFADNPNVDSVKALPEPTLLYGLPVDSFEVHQGRIRWNQNLSEILSDFNISNESIYKLANAAKGVFDVRKLKAGYNFTIIHERDEQHTARQFIFEPDLTEYVIFNLADSIFVTRNKREIIREQKTIAARVTSSIYEAVLEQNASSLLVYSLVDVFAWQVDPFRIQKGDEFKVIYEQERVGDKVVGISRVIGAWFKHFDKEYYAVYFDQGDNASYFDEEGNSLRKTFLRAPLNYSRISSRYNPRRFHPVLKRYKAHLGTDYAAPTGTEIRTVGDGVVLEARYGKYNGNYVKIKHNGVYTTQYLHMSRIARGIRPGVHVKQGDAIGYVGSTGLANGPHLCFRFWKNGRQVDALRVELPPSEPINPAVKNDFLHAKNVVLHQLDKISAEESQTVLAQIPLNQN